MAVIVTRATPSGLRAEGGAVDIPTALQAFSAIRLRVAPKEYRQLFGSATVATELPKGSPDQVMKVALGTHVDSFNVNLQELEKSSIEYFWYSVLTENQFTTYSQMDGHMPVL
eukprot:2830348-Amphidinium_carterae.1